MWFFKINTNKLANFTIKIKSCYSELKFVCIKNYHCHDGKVLHSNVFNLNVFHLHNFSDTNFICISLKKSAVWNFWMKIIYFLIF